LLLILLAARVFAELATRMKSPSVIGEPLASASHLAVFRAYGFPLRATANSDGKPGA
jgi:hypothetical protein